MLMRCANTSRAASQAMRGDLFGRQFRMTTTTRVVAGAFAVLLVGAGGYYFGQNEAVVARVNGDLGNLAQRALSMIGILGARGAQPPQQPPAPPPPDVTVLE